MQRDRSCDPHPHRRRALMGLACGLWLVGFGGVARVWHSPTGPTPSTNATATRAVETVVVYVPITQTPTPTATLWARFATLTAEALTPHPVWPTWPVPTETPEPTETTTPFGRTGDTEA